MANNNRRRPNNNRNRNSNNRNSSTVSRGGTNSPLGNISREELEKRYLQLEEKFKDLEKKLKSIPASNVQITTFPSAPVEGSSKLPPKFEAIMSKDFVAVGKEDAQIKVKISDKDLSENQIIVGDTLLIESEKGNLIKKIKVAQKVKRIDHEALVTEKDGIFYAVSQFATHRLLNHDVQTKGVLKGFELTVTLPEGGEKDSYYCLVKFVEGGEVPGDSMASISKPQYDPRVIEDDDLI